MSAFLSALEDRVRRAADMENSTFPNAELVDQINASNKRLFGLIAQVGLAETFFMEEFLVSTVAGSVFLDPLIFQVNGVDVKVGTYWYKTEPLQWQDRNRYQNIVGNSGTVDYHYQVKNLGLSPATVIELYPTPPDGTQIKVWQLKTPADLLNPADQVYYPNGWEDWIVYDVAIQLLDKEDSDSRPAQVKRQRIEQEITNQATMVDRGDAPLVRDVRHTEVDSLYLEGCGLWGI